MTISSSWILKPIEYQFDFRLKIFGVSYFINSGSWNIFFILSVSMVHSRFNGKILKPLFSRCIFWEIGKRVMQYRLQRGWSTRSALPTVIRKANYPMLVFLNNWSGSVPDCVTFTIIRNAEISTEKKWRQVFFLAFDLFYLSIICCSSCTSEYDYKKKLEAFK